MILRYNINFYNVFLSRTMVGLLRFSSSMIFPKFILRTIHFGKNVKRLPWFYQVLCCLIYSVSMMLDWKINCLRYFDLTYCSTWTFDLYYQKTSKLLMKLKPNWATKIHQLHTCSRWNKQKTYYVRRLKSSHSGYN